MLYIVTILENGRTLRIEELMYELLGIDRDELLNIKVHRKEMYTEENGVKKTPMDV